MKRRALIATVLVVGTCGAVAAIPPSGPHRRGEAAVAIRDVVPGYQQFFTQRYTVPRLEAAYERAWYLTETPLHPQAEALFTALDEATRDYAHVDLFILAHGNRYIDVVRKLEPWQREKLRLVYDTGGGSARQGPKWLSLGVGTFIGHPGGNIAPAFYVYFLPQWTKHQDAEKAMKHANDEVYELMYGRAGSLASRWMDRDRLWEGTEAQLFRR
jgi:hypothetical protein